MTRHVFCSRPHGYVGPLALLVALVIGCGGNQPEPTPPPPPPPQPTATPIVDAGSPDAAVAQAPKVWPYDKPVAVHGTKGMIVTDNAIASNVGKDVLASGGNAVDAAVATAFAMAVSYPTAGNIGGGGFAVLRMKGKNDALDFRETAPAGATRDMYLGTDGKPKSDAHEGIKSSGVPGSVAGLWELFQKYGSKKKTWAELLAPAIKLAEEGFVIDEFFAGTFEQQAGKRLLKHPISAALFFPNGKQLAKGTLFKNPELAATLKRILKGPAGFYEGDTAKAIATQMKDEGGLITESDLKKYKAKWRKPIEFSYRGNKIVSMPPPSSGGVTMAMMAHILDGYDLKERGWKSAEADHYLFEAMRRAYAARNEKLGDPDFVKMPLDELMSDKWAKDQRATIKDDKATPSSEIASGKPSGMGPHTTHFSVVDADGNAVAITTTVNWWYGSGVTVKGCGFLLNNEMDDFAAVPGQPNGFGLVQGEANAIQPGKRMLSSMSPTIVSGPDGNVKLILGAAGGPTIITATFMELSNVIDFGVDIGSAVYAPRFHMQHLPDEVVYEEAGLDPLTKTKLEAMGYTMKERGHLADAPAIAREGTEWVGVAEPRRGGGLAAAP